MYIYIYIYHIHIYIYIYIYIYTSVNPCISMHGVKWSRVKCSRVQCYRAQCFWAEILNSNFEQRFRADSGFEAGSNSDFERTVASRQARTVTSSAQWLWSMLEQCFRAHRGSEACSSSTCERPMWPRYSKYRYFRVFSRPSMHERPKAGKAYAKAPDSCENISIDIVL